MLRIAQLSGFGFFGDLGRALMDALLHRMCALGGALLGCATYVLCGVFGVLARRFDILLGAFLRKDPGYAERRYRSNEYETFHNCETRLDIALR